MLPRPPGRPSSFQGPRKKLAGRKQSTDKRESFKPGLLKKRTQPGRDLAAPSTPTGSDKSEEKETPLTPRSSKKRPAPPPPKHGLPADPAPTSPSSSSAAAVASSTASSSASATRAVAKQRKPSEMRATFYLTDQSRKLLKRFHSIVSLSEQSESSEEQSTMDDDEWLEMDCILTQSSLRISKKKEEMMISTSMSEETSGKNNNSSSSSNSWIVFLSSVTAVSKSVKSVTLSSKGLDLRSITVQTSPLCKFELSTSNKDQLQDWTNHLTSYYLSQHVWRSAPVDRSGRLSGSCVSAVHKSLTSGTKSLSEKELAGYQYVDKILTKVTKLSLDKRMLPHLIGEEALHRGIELHRLLHSIRYYFMSFVKCISRAEEVVLPSTDSLLGFVEEIDAILTEASTKDEWYLLSAPLLEYFTNKGHRTLQNLTFALVSSSRDSITSLRARLSAAVSAAASAASAGVSAAAAVSSSSSSSSTKSASPEPSQAEELRRLKVEHETLKSAFDLQKSRLGEYVLAYNEALSQLRYSQQMREKLANKIVILNREKEEMREQNEQCIDRVADSVYGLTRLLHGHSDDSRTVREESPGKNEPAALSKRAQLLDEQVRMEYLRATEASAEELDECQSAIDAILKDISELESAAKKGASHAQEPSAVGDGLVEDQMRLLLSMDSVVKLDIV